MKRSGNSAAVQSLLDHGADPDAPLCIAMQVSGSAPSAATQPQA